jgi:hypothetical protein
MLRKLCKRRRAGWFVGSAWRRCSRPLSTDPRSRILKAGDSYSQGAEIGKRVRCSSFACPMSD